VITVEGIGLEADRDACRNRTQVGSARTDSDCMLMMINRTAMMLRGSSSEYRDAIAEFIFCHLLLHSNASPSHFEPSFISDSSTKNTFKSS